MVKERDIEEIVKKYQRAVDVQEHVQQAAKDAITEEPTNATRQTS